MTPKRILKRDSLTKPKSGAGKAYDWDLGSIIFDREEKPEPKEKKRVLTEVERNFWSPTLTLD